VSTGDHEIEAHANESARIQWEWISPSLVCGQQVQVASHSWLERDPDCDATWIYRHHSQPTDEQGMWRARRVDGVAPLVGAIETSKVLWDLGVEEFLRKQRDAEADAFELQHPPLVNDADNTCWMNAVLQAVMSVLMDLRDNPAELEFGTTEAAHSIFMCAFDELARTPVCKPALIAKMVRYGLVDAGDIGQQDDASMFMCNLMYSGPLSHIAELSHESGSVCGTCNLLSPITTASTLKCLDIPLCASSDRACWTPSKVQETTDHTLNEVTPCVTRPCGIGECPGQCATKLELAGRLQPCCLVLKFQRSRGLHQQGVDTGGPLVRTSIGLPPSLRIRNGGVGDAVSLYRLTAVVFHTGHLQGRGVVGGHFTAAVRDPAGPPVATMVRWSQKATCLRCDDSVIDAVPVQWREILQDENRRRSIHLAFYTREPCRLDPVSASTLFDRYTAAPQLGQVFGVQSVFATAHAQTQSGPGHDARRGKRKRKRSRTKQTFVRLTDPNRMEALGVAEDDANDDALD
jgi:hypothetical protein